MAVEMIGKKVLFGLPGGPRAPSIASVMSELFLKAVIEFPPESVAF
jgi:molybdopterin biosynthesis enzyme